jgi:hypothetical protein
MKLFHFVLAVYSLLVVTLLASCAYKVNNDLQLQSIKRAAKFVLNTPNLQ